MTSNLNCSSTFNSEKHNNFNEIIRIMLPINSLFPFIAPMAAMMYSRCSQTSYVTKDIAHIWEVRYSFVKKFAVVTAPIITHSILWDKHQDDTSNSATIIMLSATSLLIGALASDIFEYSVSYIYDDNPHPFGWIINEAVQEAIEMV